MIDADPKLLPAPILPEPAARRRTLRTALGTWWTNLWRDDWTAYLENATDLGDLDRRMRQWDRRDPNSRP